MENKHKDDTASVSERRWQQEKPRLPPLVSPLYLKALFIR